MTTTNSASPIVPQGWNFSASLCTDFRFQSETNLEIDADVFRLTYHKWRDEEGAIRTSESAFGPVLTQRRRAMAYRPLTVALATGCQGRKK